MRRGEASRRERPGVGHENGPVGRVRGRRCTSRYAMRLSSEPYSRRRTLKRAPKGSGMSTRLHPFHSTPPLVVGDLARLRSASRATESERIVLLEREGRAMVLPHCHCGGARPAASGVADAGHVSASTSRPSRVRAMKCAACEAKQRSGESGVAVPCSTAPEEAGDARPSASASTPGPPASTTPGTIGRRPPGTWLPPGRPGACAPPPQRNFLIARTRLRDLEMRSQQARERGGGLAPSPRTPLPSRHPTPPHSSSSS